MTIADTLFPKETKSRFNEFGHFLVNASTRTAVGWFAGYYFLGVAYHLNVMRSIDSIVIKTLYDRGAGYFGIGIALPEVQRYSALIVRTVTGFIAGILYDLAERVVIFVYRKLKIKFSDPPPPASPPQPASAQV